MRKQAYFNFLFQSFLVGLILLAVMSIARLVFFISFKADLIVSDFISDTLAAFWLGVRLDLTVVGYILAPAFLSSIAIYPVPLLTFKLFKYYYFLAFVLLLVIIGIDFGFYSFFKEHFNILVFGFFYDDTQALIQTIWQNYPVPAIMAVFVFISFVFYKIFGFIFAKDFAIQSFLGLKQLWLILPLVTILIFLACRGTIADMYPLGKMLPSVSKNKFINKMRLNSVRSFVDAYKIRKKFNADVYDLIKDTGFKGNIQKAFMIYNQAKDENSSFNSQDLLANITYKTSTKTIDDYHLLVIMVESFGMPILNYQSQDFDLMRSLKKHFDQDIVFTNFLSSANGTINSLESMLLNIPFRPDSFAFSQSKYRATEFSYSPAFVFSEAAYQPSFIYGGFLSWRSFGPFVSRQGYDVKGQLDIFDSLKAKDESQKDYMHAWGIFDEFFYDYIYKQLINAKQKQFIFALSTNNHPPYEIPKQYQSKPLKISPKLEKILTSNLDLMYKRFYSYQYALDQLGQFLDRFKASKLAANTVVVITADNNTIAGNMSYKENQLLQNANIPLYFYLPPKLLKQVKAKLGGNIDTKVFGSHKDIFPTLYNLLLSDKEYLALGTDLLDAKAFHIGFNASKTVASANKVQELNVLSKTYKDFEANYYRASLAITQYLIYYFYKQDKAKKAKK